MIITIKNGEYNANSSNKNYNKANKSREKPRQHVYIVLTINLI